MKIDEQSVILSDQVWHDRYGWGVVVGVQQGTCDVKFTQSQRALTFAEGGKQNGYKVLYWQPPMLFVPRKGVDYSKFLHIVSGLHDQLFGEQK